MENIPQNPEKYHPVHLLYEMAPGINFTEKTLSLHNPSLFEVCCELNGMSFKGQGNVLIIFNKFLVSSFLSLKIFWQILAIFIIFKVDIGFIYKDAIKWFDLHYK